MSNTELKKPGKKEMQITQQVFHLLLEITELYPQYPIAQHWACILRRKSDEGETFYFWSNEELLKRIEQYKDELERGDLTEEEAAAEDY